MLQSSRRRMTTSGKTRELSLLETIDGLLEYIEKYNVLSDGSRDVIVIINDQMAAKHSVPDSIAKVIPDAGCLDISSLHQQSDNDKICQEFLSHRNGTKFIFNVFQSEQSILRLMDRIRSQSDLQSASIYSFLLSADLSMEYDRALDPNQRSQHQIAPHSLGQWIDTTDGLHSECIASKIKDLLTDYELMINHWDQIYPRYLMDGLDAQNPGTMEYDHFQCDLEPLDFLDRFKEIIVSRKKRATTRWMKGEPLNVDLSPNKWMVATTGTGRAPFAILYVHRVEQCRLKDIGDDIAKIENMESGTELIVLLKEIYPDLSDEDMVDIVHFTCCHMISD